MNARVTLAILLALALTACGGSLQVDVLPQSGCASQVSGALALTNGGGNAVVINNPTSDFKFVAYDDHKAQVAHGSVSVSNDIQPQLTVAPHSTITTDSFVFWDAQGQPAATYGLQITLSDGSQSQTTWFSLPGCAPQTGP